MTELLVLLLVAAAYALGKAREERDRLLLLLLERWAGSGPQRLHWQPIEQHLEAEQQLTGGAGHQSGVTVDETECTVNRGRR